MWKPPLVSSILVSWSHQMILRCSPTTVACRHQPYCSGEPCCSSLSGAQCRICPPKPQRQLNIIVFFTLVERCFLSQLQLHRPPVLPSIYSVCQRHVPESRQFSLWVSAAMYSMTTPGQCSAKRFCTLDSFILILPQMGSWGSLRLSDYSHSLTANRNWVLELNTDLPSSNPLPYISWP